MQQQPHSQPFPNVMPDTDAILNREGDNRRLLSLQSAQSHVSSGNQAYANYIGKHDRDQLGKAIDHYRQALDLDPRLPEAHLKLGVALWQRGDLTVEIALKYCQSALSLDNGCAEAYLYKGHLLADAGMYADATENYTLAVGKSTQKEKAKTRLALANHLLSRAVTPERTVSLFSRGTWAVRGLFHGLQGLSVLHRDKATCEEFSTALRGDVTVLGLTTLGRLFKSAGLNRSARVVYGWGCASMPQDSLFPHLLGDLYQGSLKDNALAVAHYEAALALEPGKALLHKKLGFAYARMQEIQKAVHHFESALECDASHHVEPDFETRYGLAQIYAEQADYLRALFHYRELQELEPKNPYLHSHMGYVLYRMEDYEGAIAAYRQAVDMGKDPIWTATIAQTLGTIHYQTQHDLEAAESMLKMAWKLDGENLESLTLLGDIYTEQGRFEEALRIYTHLSSLEPDNTDCCNYLGYLLWQLDRHEEAIRHYRRSIELSPQNPIASNNLGVIYLDELCLPEVALALFETAVAQKEDYTLARFNVARSLHALGRTSEAAKRYAEALACNQEHPELEDAEIHERLQRLFEV